MDKARLFELDGLRAFAIALVVLFHLRVPGFSAGYLGVDLFFILSGFLMTHTMLRERVQHGRFQILAFYGRRFHRLAPSLALIVLAVLVVGFLLMSPVHLRDLAAQSIRAITFTSNHYFFEQASYFDLSNEVRPLLHTWSLSVEEQFYLFFGVLLFLGNRMSFRRVALIAFVLALLGAGFILGNREMTSEARITLPFIQPEKYEAAMFYLLPQRLFQFMTGVMLGLSALRQRIVLQGPIAVCALVIPIVAYIIVQAFLEAEYATLMMTVFATLLFLPNALLAKFGQVFLVQKLAKISYQLYLTHWPIIVFWRYVTGTPLGMTDVLIVLVLSLVTAWMVYRLTLPKTGAHTPNKLLLIGAPLLAAVTGMSVMLADGATWRIPHERVYTTPKDMRAEESAYCYGSHLNEEGKDFGGQVNGPLITCENTRPGKPVIYVIGDSHARHLLAGLSEAYPEHQISILYYTNCLAQSGLGDYRLAYKGGRAKENKCVARNLAALDFFAEAPPSTIIIHQYAGHANDESEVWYEAADILLQTLKNTPHRLVWIGSVLRPDVAISECLNVPAIISERQLTRRCKGRREILKAVYQKNQALKMRYPDVYINPNDFFCPGHGPAECITFKDGTLLFRDKHHLTVKGSILFISELREKLETMAGLRVVQ